MADDHEKPLVLFAEDDKYFLKIVLKYLEKEPYEVLTASDGQEALSLVRQHIPDLVLSDWMMPNLSGEELCRIIKQDEQLKQIYFIIVTARSQIKDRIMGLEFGADDFVVKPCDPRELVARVHTGLRIVALQRELTRLQAVKAINQTAITANHEINNPLQTIITSADFLLSQNNNLSGKEKKLLRHIINSAFRIREVTAKLEHLTQTVTKEYTPSGPFMIDLERSLFNNKSESGTENNPS